jgi:hypothetical protein
MSQYFAWNARRILLLDAEAAARCLAGRIVGVGVSMAHPDQVDVIVAMDDEGIAVLPASGQGVQWEFETL